MNDARLSPELLAAERAREREVLRAVERSGMPAGRPRGILTAEQAAARRDAVSADGTVGARALVVPAARVPPPRSDPEQAMRIVRLSLAVVLVLVLCLVWIRQRRWR